MNWFFTCTNYSNYSKEYDGKKRQNNNYNRKYYYDQDYSEDEDKDANNYQESKNEYNKIKSEYSKKKALMNWIKNGKNGIQPPKTLNFLIKELENNKKEFILYL